MRKKYRKAEFTKILIRPKIDFVKNIKNFQLLKIATFCDSVECERS